MARAIVWMILIAFGLWIVEKVVAVLMDLLPLVIVFALGWMIFRIVKEKKI